jgi:hypothetical protein
MSKDSGDIHERVAELQARGEQFSGFELSVFLLVLVVVLVVVSALSMG